MKKRKGSPVQVKMNWPEFFGEVVKQLKTSIEANDFESAITAFHRRGDLSDTDYNNLSVKLSEVRSFHGWEVGSV